MIREIESHCDDVICLAQNFLQLTPSQFEAICNEEQVDQVMTQTEAELLQKQKQLQKAIKREAHDCGDSTSEDESGDDDYED